MHPTTPFSHKFVKLSYTIVNSSLVNCFQKLFISIMVHPAQSPETIPAPMPSCWFTFARMWLFVFIYVSADSWDGFAEKFFTKYYFLMWRWSIESVPEISLPPCINSSQNVDIGDWGRLVPFLGIHKSKFLAVRRWRWASLSRLVVTARLILF